MLSIVSRSSISGAIIAVLVAAFLLAIGCQNEPPASTVNVAPFIAMARAAECTEVSNRLFLIDERSVFWDRRGTCIDGLYSLTLYGSTPDVILCERHDAVGGGNVTNCPDESHRDMFETMRVSLDQPDLGLGTGHSVQPVPF
jgi:hypothetical protein